MSLLCVSESFVAIANNKEISWKQLSSLSFNSLNIPFEVKSDVNNGVKQSTPVNNEYVIKDLSFSPDNKYLVVLTSTKDLFIYSTHDFSIVCKHQLPRAASKAVFSFDSQYVLVADKTGDVLIYKTKDHNEPGKKIFGHLSLLTDILMSRDNKFIITCDRDEKIRVTNYPGSYNIESFCLGHREFVTSIDFLPHNERYLVSASGDGTIRIWNYLLGKEVFSINTHAEAPGGILEKFKDAMKTEYVEIECLPISHLSCCKSGQNSSLLAVSLYLDMAMIIFKVSGEDSQIESSIAYKIALEGYPASFVISQEKLLVYLKGDKRQLQEWALRSDGSYEKGFCEIFEEKCSQKSSMENADDISVLYKRKFDNLQDYHKRKKLRIEGHGK